MMQRSRMDLSGQDLTKVPLRSDWSGLDSINLSNNHLTRLENIENLADVKEMYLACNQLVRVCPLSSLSMLTVLDLSDNRLQSAEGVHRLYNLQRLSLSGNAIQKLPLFEKLVHLVHLDVSRNKLTALPNLKQCPLEVLNLDENQIVALEGTSRCLPESVRVFCLTRNSIRDLTQFSFVSCLANLEQLSTGGNPCLDFSGQKEGFNYRPYLVCCSPGLKFIDGFVVGEREVLKGEWLFSQGKGRKFLPGQHRELVEYLSSVCPLVENMESGYSNLHQSEEDIKLMRVLAKRHEWRPHSEPVNSNVPSLTLSSTTSRPNTTMAVIHPMKTESMPPRVSPSGQSADDQSDSETAYLNPYTAYDNRVVVSASQSPFYGQKGHPGSPISRSERPNSQQRLLTWAEQPVRLSSARRHRRLRSPFGRPKSMSSNAGGHNFRGADVFAAENELFGSAAAAARKRWNFSPVPPLLKTKETPPPTRCPSTISERSGEDKSGSGSSRLRKSPGASLASLDVQKSGSVFTIKHHHAASVIQALWRGYRTRNLLPEIQEIYKEIRFRRLEHYAQYLFDQAYGSSKQEEDQKEAYSVLCEMIKKLRCDFEAFKVEREKRVEQVLLEAQKAQVDESKIADKSDLAELSANYQVLKYQLSSILPPPTSLSFTWKSASSGILSWKAKPGFSDLEGIYHVYVDNMLCGEVKNGKNKALVTDLDNKRVHQLFVRYLTASGIESFPSQELVLSPSTSVPSASAVSVQQQQHNTTQHQTSNGILPHQKDSTPTKSNAGAQGTTNKPSSKRSAEHSNIAKPKLSAASQQGLTGGPSSRKVPGGRVSSSTPAKTGPPPPPHADTSGDSTFPPVVISALHRTPSPDVSLITQDQSEVSALTEHDTSGGLDVSATLSSQNPECSITHSPESQLYSSGEQLGN